jgi:hypothetical protein
MELKTQCRERFKPAMDAIKEILKQEENTDQFSLRLTGDVEVVRQLWENI